MPGGAGAVGAAIVSLSGEATRELGMTWVQVQRAHTATWEHYESVQRALGDEVPDGLILHAAGEVDGHWRAVSVWESREAFARFRDARLLPAVQQALGADFAAAGPPADEWFEVGHQLPRAARDSQR
jgi:hypothetical protein